MNRYGGTQGLPKWAKVLLFILALGLFLYGLIFHGYGPLVGE